MSECIYYVYVWCNKHGVPYYVGKGKNNRAWVKHYKYNPPPIERIYLCETKLTEIGALSIERRLIKWYGRRGIDEGGILVNRSEGGDGNTSPTSEETKKKISNSHSGKVIPDDVRVKISKTMKEKGITWNETAIQNSIETRKKLYPDGVMKGRKQSNYQKLRSSETHKNKKWSDESLRKLKESLGKVKKIQCIHCLNYYRPPTYSRYHGDKCKNRYV